MTGSEDKTGKKTAGLRGSGRICKQRAAELVRAVKGGGDQPFGPLRLVRAVIRPAKRKPG